MIMNDGPVQSQCCPNCGADLSVIRCTACCDQPLGVDVEAALNAKPAGFTPTGLRSAESKRLKYLMDSARGLRELRERGEISMEEYHDHLDVLRLGPREPANVFVRVFRAMFGTAS